ncbi:MAG: ABC transporter permease, partial [Deltaproteobacteria bacterium]|nr:ABC transporter permease [Deltaproteobacteria bacterium]
LIGLVLDFPFRWTITLIPVAMIPLFIFCLGCSILVGIATVYFRDMQYLLSVLLQLLYFATPILYPLEIIPEKYSRWLAFNPVVPELHLFQKLIYMGQIPSQQEWAIAWAVAILALVAGVAVLLLLEEDLVFRM